MIKFDKLENFGGQGCPPYGTTKRSVMVETILEFCQKSSFILFLFGVGAFCRTYWENREKIGFFKYVFGFGAFKIMKNNDFKPKDEVKNKKDKLYNLKEYFVYYNAIAMIAFFYAILYVGLFGIILDIIVRLIRKGN